jgi:hypothetical protein
MPIVKASSRDSRGYQVISSQLAFQKRVLFAQNKPWGKEYYADGIDGSDSYDGLSPERAKKTIQAAVTAGGVEDVVYIRPKTWTGYEFGYPGLNTAYAESIIIPYAKAGLALVGIGNQGFHGIPCGVVIRETASAITANMKVYAPLCAFENLCFERGGSETGGQLVFLGGTQGTYEAHAGSVYNCYFYYGQGTSGPGGWGGGIMADQVWSLVVDNCYFLGCRGGVSFQSGGWTAGNLIVSNSKFFSRNATASEIDFDIWAYMQGAQSVLITDCQMAHLIPSLTGGAVKKWIKIYGDTRQGLINNIGLGGVMGTTYTCGVAGTAIAAPANVGVSNVYCDNALLATNA